MKTNTVEVDKETTRLVRFGAPAAAAREWLLKKADDMRAKGPPEPEIDSFSDDEGIDMSGGR